MKHFRRICLSVLLLASLVLGGPGSTVLPVCAKETEAETDASAQAPAGEEQASIPPSETVAEPASEQAAGTADGADAEAGADGMASAPQDAKPGPAPASQDAESEVQSEEETEDPMLYDPIFGLKVGESKTIPMRYLEETPLSTAAPSAQNAAQSADGLEHAELDTAVQAASGVTVKVNTVYYYSEVGYGDGTGQGTHKYTVSFNGYSAVAYCLQPSKDNPKGSDSFTIKKLDDGKLLSKVIYYAGADADHGGYFALKHPGYSAAKKFVITHIAAAKANGSSDWDHGINADGKKAAQALIDYANSMPDLPDATLAFAPPSVGASEQGNLLRSGNVTLQADAANTATVPLPSGVALNNLTDGARSATGTAHLKGGDVFYLTLAKPALSGTEVTLTAAGEVAMDYAAYKIKTDRDTQDLGLVFAEGVPGQNQTSLRVTFTPSVTVSAVKTDAETTRVLSGAAFGLFAGADMTEASGAVRKKGDLLQEASTGADGKAVFSYRLTTDCSYYVQETKAPYGYVRNQTASISFTFKAGANSLTPQTYSGTIPDTPVKGEIALTKLDRELYRDAPDDAYGAHQGDATLEGAVYGLYAREDIVRPDQSGSVLYRAGELIAQGTTDMRGDILWSDLWLGKYQVKELSPSRGYVLDETVYPVDVVYEDDLTPLVHAEVAVTEQVIKQPFQIIKAAKNEDTDAPLLEGAGFSAWLLSALPRTEDGTDYDYASADPVPLCTDGSTELFTDADGYAVSIPIPYGTYLVKETTTPDNYSPVKPFLVHITEHHPDTPQVWRILLDEEYKAKLRLIKKDAKSGSTILKAGAEFRIYSVDADSYVEQVTTYPRTTVHKSYSTDDSGTLTLPSALRPGTYRIEEVASPYGYQRLEEGITFAIDAQQAVQQDAVSGDLILEQVVEDTPVTGRLELVKKGPMLTGYDGTHFIYEVKGLAGAVFEVRAEEDIARPDAQKDESGNEILLYRKGQIAGELRTDANGEAALEALPLGKYTVTETAAPYGCAKITTPFHVELKPGDGNSAVVTEHLEVTDPKQRVELSVLKQSADGSRKPLKGAEFTLYAKEDIHARSSDGTREGRVLVPKGTAVAKAVSDKNGKAAFASDLPQAVFTLRETKAPQGYQLSKKKITVDATWKSGDAQVLTIEKTVRDKPATGRTSDPGTSVQNGAPKTGDRAPLVLLALCAVLSLTAAAVLLLFRRKMIHGHA